MTKYDWYRVMAKDGHFIRGFNTKREAVSFLKELYLVTHNRMYILDIKGNVVFEWYAL